MWWKQHVEEFPHLVRMVRQYLPVPVTPVSPERLLNSVGFVNSVVTPDVRSSGEVEVTSDTRRQSLIRPDVRPFFFSWRETIFWGKKRRKKTFFLWNQGHSEAEEAQYMTTVHTNEIHSQNRDDRRTDSLPQKLYWVRSRSPLSSSWSVSCWGEVVKLLYVVFLETLSYHLQLDLVRRLRQIKNLDKKLKKVRCVAWTVFEGVWEEEGAQNLKWMKQILRELYLPQLW
jgi:hypothetical protein